jgi:outer membrane biosynthesis protein TonB
MKLPAKIVLALLPVFLTACNHKTQQAQVQPLAPPVEVNPPPPPSTAPVNLPPPVATIPPEPTKTAPTVATKPPGRRKKNKNNNAASAAPVQEAANPAPNPGVSAIGQLSSGDPADFRKETEDTIAATERGLNGITRTLSDTEQKTADHIRDFLKQAKTALASGDVDGAHTLAAKAKILLQELTG